MYLEVLTLNKCKANMNPNKAILVLHKLEFKAKTLQDLKCHFNQKMVILVIKIKHLKILMCGLI